MKQWIISALLRIYPAAWRREYGPELHNLLQTLRLRVRTVANVAWNGARQRLRATEPWVLLGLPFALIGTFAAVVGIVAPPPYPSGINDGPPSLGLLANMLGLLVNLLLAVSCGLWTVARSGGTLAHAGLQTTKMVLLALAPRFIVNALVLTGALGVVFIGPGDTPTTVVEHGFTIGVYRADDMSPPLEVMLVGQMFVTLFSLIAYWVLGAIGGAFGRSVRAKLQSTH